MTANLPLRMLTPLAAPQSGRPQWRWLQQHFAAIGGRPLRALIEDGASRGAQLRHHCPTQQRHA